MLDLPQTGRCRVTSKFLRMDMAMAMATMDPLAKVGIDPLDRKALLGL